MSKDWPRHVTDRGGPQDAVTDTPDTNMRKPEAFHRQSQLLKNILKMQLRNRGVRYKDIAEHLGVSEMTVKRHLNAERVPIETLEDICGCIGLSLIELAEIAKSQSSQSMLDPELEQERALADDYNLALMRLLLYSGMTVPEIMSEYQIDETLAVSLLVRLDRLGLIELLPGNRVRIRGPRYVDWKPGGPIRQTIERDIRERFVTIDFTNTEDFFGYESVRLTKASLRQLEDYMRHFVRQVRLLQQVDQNAANAEKTFYTVCIAHKESRWGFHNL